MANHPASKGALTTKHGATCRVAAELGPFIAGFAQGVSGDA